MGVKGLWKLLDGTGRPVDMNSLEGKILAVDISVWLNMAVKGMRDYHGHASQTAHLVSLFSRICKLLYHGIKPVFVFDGKAPALKQKTLRDRRERKTVNVREGKKANEKILQNFLKRQLLDEVTHGEAKASGNSESGRKLQSDSMSSKPTRQISQKLHQEEDIYNLPPLSTNLHNSDDSELEEELSMRAELQREFQDNINHNEFGNMLNMNIDSNDFNSLPSDVQYELLQDLHEVRKRQRTRLEMMPEESKSFSNYQIEGLLAKRKITKKIESVENKMSQEHAEASSTFFGVDRASMESHTVVARQLVSDSKSHFIWLRKLSNERGNIQDDHKPVDRVGSDDTSSSRISQPDKQPILDPENLIAPIKNTKEPTSNDNKNLLSSCNLSKDLDTASIKIEDSKEIDTEPQPSENPSGGHDFPHEAAASLSESNLSKSSQSSNSLKASSPRQDTDILCESEKLNDQGLDIAPVQDQTPVHTDTLTTMVMAGSVQNSPNLLRRSSEKIVKLKSDPKDDSDVNQDIVTTETTLTTPLNTPATSINIVHGGALAADISDASDSVDSEYNFVDVPDDVQSEGIDMKPPSSSDEIAEVLLQSDSFEQAGLGDENPWDGLDVTDIGKYATEMDNQSKELHKLMQARERAARDVSQSAQLECQDLLKLFGVPYIVSPQEAEAQCAALEEIGLTDGTITDDSDIWLFGGKYVIKDMFGSRKDPVAYNASDIKTQLGLNRDRFICIALCSGSDYTRGIHGVGPVTAMEILKEFEGTGINGLVKLKQWWEDIVTTTKQTIPTETKIKSQLRRVNLMKDFPSEAVYNAYTSPIVDTNNTRFEWGFPDLDELRMFATETMHWTRQRVDEILLPVIKRQGQRRSAQSKMTNYFQATIHSVDKKRSKRVQRAAAALTGKQDSNKPSSSKRRKKKANPKKVCRPSEVDLSEPSSED